MQIFSRPGSIRRKLLLFITGITGAALLLFLGLSVVSQAVVFRQSMILAANALGDAAAELSRPLLGEPEKGFGWMKVLQDRGEIDRIAVFDVAGKTVASSGIPAAEKENPIPSVTGSSAFVLQRGSLDVDVFRPVFSADGRIGTVYLRVRIMNFMMAMTRLALLSTGGLLVLLAAASIASRTFTRRMTESISSVTDAAGKIAASGEYDIRVKKTSDDEIGALADAFNGMMAMIRQKSLERSDHRHHLEILVDRRTEELRIKRDEALAAARAKSEFLANMSHEIRTPMNGIIGVLSLLRDAPLNEEHRRLLQTATRSADSLLLIINDILDFSKIEAGKIDFESIVFDLRDLMEEVTLLFIEAAKLKQLNLLCFMPTDVDSCVVGDPTRLRQVLTNLLSNAVKFTDRGEVILQVALVKKQGGQQWLRFSVEDTGIGIASEALKNLFQKFTQADGTTTRKYGGTGLGLSVCKQLVELQHGEIGVDSEEGRGAIFWFTLPMRIVEGEVPKTSPVDIAGKRFLVVDDNPTNRLIIEHYLKSCHVQATLRADGEEAFAEIIEASTGGKPFDTVLLDYHMPGMDGLELAGRIMQEFGKDAPRLILLSSEGGVREKAAKAGVRDIVYKPIRLAQFYEALKSIPARTEGAGQEKNERSDTGSEYCGSVLLVDDEPINQKVGVAILKKFGIEPDIAGNGREAVQKSGERHYDLILMDIQMPEMSGFDATEAIRKRERETGQARIPIVAMTANAMESTRERCLSIGMDDFIAKPIRPDMLMERLQPWLKVNFSLLPGGSKVKPPALRKSSGAERIWDQKKALQFVGGDEVLLRELADLFLKRHDFLLDRIGKAIESGDADALHDAGHAYKGAVNHFASETIRELAFSLEKLGRAGTTDGAESVYNDLRDRIGRLLEELRVFLGTEE